jgi:hypothetical protein
MFILKPLPGVYNFTNYSSVLFAQNFSSFTLSDFEPFRRIAQTSFMLTNFKELHDEHYYFKDNHML